MNESHLLSIYHDESYMIYIWVNLFVVNDNAKLNDVNLNYDNSHGLIRRLSNVMVIMYFRV